MKIHFMPSKIDPDNQKENGAIDKYFKTREDVIFTTREYKDQIHGWVNRGEINDPIVKQGVENAINESIAFFAQ